MNDKTLNEYIDSLLEWSTQKRIDSNGKWAELFDSAMAMWVDRHPGTRPQHLRSSDRHRLVSPERCLQFMKVINESR